MVKTNLDASVSAEWFRGTYPKKYKVVLYDRKSGKKIKTVQFGHQDYEHYHDSTPLKLYTKSNHGDKKRRDNYRSRHGTQGFQNKKYTPAWFSWYYLW